MGWFWRGQDDDKLKPSTENPLNNLDPSLRDFLDKESPAKYSSTNPPAPSETPYTPQSPHEHQTNTSQSKPEKSTEHNSTAPPQSLYKDGRYAHLWSTYVPQAELESAYKSDAEKINDVLDGYKQRKAEIGRAALENCALEQWDVNECFRNGGWASRLTLCRTENRKLERCYLMQAKFLKALGYLSVYDRPREIDEKIQMHADTLYHRMLDQEAAIEAAQAEGRPVPAFPPLVSSTSTAVQAWPKESLKLADLSPEIQAELGKRLEGLDDKAKELEAQAIDAEIKAGEQVASRLESIYHKQEEEKKARKEQGRETVGDRMSSLFGFR